MFNSRNYTFSLLLKLIHDVSFAIFVSLYPCLFVLNVPWIWWYEFRFLYLDYFALEQRPSWRFWRLKDLPYKGILLSLSSWWFTNHSAHSWNCIGHASSHYSLNIFLGASFKESICPLVSVENIFWNISDLHWRNTIYPFLTKFQTTKFIFCFLLIRCLKKSSITVGCLT